MKDLVRQFMDTGISRRQLVAGLTATGLGAVNARAVAKSLDEPIGLAAGGAAAREVRGSGGELFVQQLKAAGVEFIFFNPGTYDSPIFDALVDEPSIQVIKGVHEGAVVAMADGYARISGKVGVIVVAQVGLPNAMTQMINSWKDRIPLLVVIGSTPQELAGREGPQEVDHREDMTTPITKWHWTIATTASIPEMTRRAIKFASTPPCGPVFLDFPGNILAEEATASVIDQAKFAVPMRIRPDQADIKAAARLLIDAKNPLLSIGDEITWCHGEKELLELAELLGLPVAGQAGMIGFWSKPFPTRHPLFIGMLQNQMRFPGDVDVLLNLGAHFGESPLQGAKKISMRLDPGSLARSAAIDVGMVADLRLGIADLLTAIKSMAIPEKLAAVARQRMERSKVYWEEMAALRRTIAKEDLGGPGISMIRLATELEATLDKDTIYISEADSGKKMDQFMSFGGSDKSYYSVGPAILGWGMAAAFGAKLAQPNRPVVAVVGDGGFLFSGPMPLWSVSRYKAPITIIVLNNKSYNGERNRIWASGGAQFQTGRDMSCYLGSPDVDYSKMAQAFEVESEKVDQLSQLRPALARAKHASTEGRPYLIDVNVKREGSGSASTWHPEYSVADQRSRRV
jgi:benzoylformate decarboxylase